MIPLFAFPPPIRRVTYTTNAIASINSQRRKIIKSGHFPSADAASKLIWLALRNIITADWGRAAKDWKEWTSLPEPRT